MKVSTAFKSYLVLSDVLDHLILLMCLKISSNFRCVPVSIVSPLPWCFVKANCCLNCLLYFAYNSTLRSLNALLRSERRRFVYELMTSSLWFLSNAGRCDEAVSARSSCSCSGLISSVVVAALSAR